MSENKALELRYYNTLHGFQQPSKENIAICFIHRYCAEAPEYERFSELQHSDWPKHIATIKEKDPQIEFCIDDFIGHVYLKTDRGHRSQIPRIINACIAAGYALKLLTRLETRFVPDGKSNLPYSIENSERLAIRHIEEQLAQFSYLPNALNILISDGRKELLADERLWKTDEGKCFARKLLAKITDQELIKRIKMKVLIPDHPDVDLELDFPLKTLPEQVEQEDTNERRRKMPAAVVASPTRNEKEEEHKVKQEEKKKEEEEHEPRECLVCCERIADTLVLPCNDCVVCKKCSEGLRKTNDNATCLRCRRPIHTVLWDGGSETKS